VRLGLFEVEGIQVKDIKENLIHIQQNFNKKLAELLQEVNEDGKAFTRSREHKGRNRTIRAFDGTYI